MKINIKVRYSRRLKKGYPVIVEMYHNGKRKYLSFGYFTKKNDWDNYKQLPLPSHPDYDYLLPTIIEIKKKLKTIRYNGITDFQQIKVMLQGATATTVNSFSAFGDQLIAEQRKRKLYANARVYNTALRNFEKYLDRKITFNDIEYKNLLRYKDYKLTKVSPNTIHNYLRTIRAIYNEAVRRGYAIDTRPFKNIFTGISVRNSMQRKKYLTKMDIIKLENIELQDVAAYMRDLFLLQFYFGGQDLKDIYFLKRSRYVNGRIYFERGKLSGKGYAFDLRVFEKARAIIEQYTAVDGYIFPGRKDFEGYRTFYRRYLRYLKRLQVKLDINIQPFGGNLAAKVPRHTFANIGKRLFIEEDILRELMGHERNDIDNYYKDKYPADVRDAAHWKIIDTTNLM